jgi:hypothetical protein
VRTLSLRPATARAINPIGLEHRDRFMREFDIEFD